MNNPRTHHVTTTDGVTIAGTVHGHGAPVVFVQGIIGDGDLDWHRLLGHLTGRFTCHLPSLRGRGLSGDHPDLSPGRMVEDLLSYVESIGEEIGLVGWSGGASMALALAAQSDAVREVVAVEPGVLSLMDEQEQAALGDAVDRLAELAAEGRLTDALRAFARWPFGDQDLAVAEAGGYLEAAGRYVPNLLNLLQQLMAHENATAEPPALGAICAPVLVLHGSGTKPYFVTSAAHVADNVPRAQVQVLAGAEHASPLTHPESLADALTEFFSWAQQKA